ncbi:MAG: preprotein translocase subunit SecG [Clostridiales bacterium]|nr:preprotein translocase subunit SecG [Clostridiales bacterium]
MLKMLLASSDFVTTVFPVVRIVCMVIICLLAIGLIITTILQSSADENGATAVTGQESYYSQNKGESRDGKLKKLTVIFASIIVFCILLYFITWVIM